jgi:hypothetical protein
MAERRPATTQREVQTHRLIVQFFVWSAQPPRAVAPPADERLAEIASSRFRASRSHAGARLLIFFYLPVARGPALHERDGIFLALDRERAPRIESRATS